MSDYSKLAAVIIRSFGLIILLYAAPMLTLGVVKVAARAVLASDGQTPIGSATLGWLLYALAGLLLFFLAKPLGRVAARGFDDPRSAPPAA